MNGIIYILSHKAMPDLLKIGFTSRGIDERVRELSSTGVPGKFIVELYFKAENAPLFEMLLHEALCEFHYDKEFFKADIKTAVHAIHGLMRRDDIRQYRFYGRCSSLATTQEQIDEQKKVEDERRKRLEDRSNQLAARYLNKTADELRNEMRILLDEPTYQNVREAKKLIRMIEAMREQESKDRIRKWQESDEYKAIQANKATYEAQLKSTYTDLGRKVFILLKQVSPNTFIGSLMAFGFGGGKRISKKMTPSEKRLILDFYEISTRVHSLTSSYNFKDLGISKYDNPTLLISNEADDFSDFFKGVLAECQ